MNSIASIKKAFNRSQLSYDEHCMVQQYSGEKLLSLIRNNSIMPRILDLGCGTGLMTQKLATAFNYHDFHALDIANQLLVKARERLLPFHIHTYEADFNHLPDYAEPFDLIFSNMSLQWSTNLHTTLSNLAALLSSSGLLAFSIPLAGTFAELHPHFSLNNFIDLASFTQQLNELHYDSVIAHQEKLTLQFENTLSTLQSIKHVGANCVVNKSHRGLRGKAFINQCNLRELTYVIGYFVVTKKAIACR